MVSWPSSLRLRSRVRHRRRLGTSLDVSQSQQGASSDRFADLHAHSVASDGSATPAEFVAIAREVGLSIVALTDHDSVAGVAAAREAAAQGTALEVLAGVELSAFDGDLEVHVLGLRLQRVEALESVLRQFRTNREARAVHMVEVLNTLGVAVTMDDVRREAAGGAIGRPHIARAIIAAGLARDIREVFDRYLGTGRPAFVPKEKLSVDRAFSMIRDAGGVSVWAHPGREGTLSRIRGFAARGLQGVEVIHPSHNAEDTARLRTVAEHLGLLMSGGSDWHGAREGLRALGAMRVPAVWAERIASAP